MAEPPRTVAAVGDVLRSAGLLLETHGPGDVVVGGAAQDSRRVEAGDVFLAWTGTSADAHDHLADAVDAGAVAAVVERRVADVDVPQLVVADGRRAAAVVADALAGSPWADLFMAAVTGTNGKTTTALMVRHILAERGPAAAVGTLGVVDADGVRPGTEGLTTPGPVQLAEWLRALVDDGIRSVVMEASSHALDQRRLDGVRFDVAVFTNLSQDHLDYHPDLQAYRDAKARLVELVRDGGAVVVNADEPAWAAVDVAGRRTVRFGLDAPDAHVRADIRDLAAAGTRFDLVSGDDVVAVDLPLPGRFNVENALAAAGVALVAGMEAADVAEALSSLPQVAGRLEVVHAGAFTVLVDFAHTPDALQNVLDALRPLTQGRLVVLFGAGGDRDRAKRRPMAAAVAERADVVILTSDNPRTEDPERILDDLAEGLAGRDYHRDADRRAAIHHAVAVARDGDTVLLAGKGHETYQIVGHEKRPFDERVVVREALMARGVA